MKKSLWNEINHAILFSWITFILKFMNSMKHQGINLISQDINLSSLANASCRHRAEQAPDSSAGCMF